jgi:hypothetical protein
MRQSLATYYYTNGRPIEEESEAHSTLFQERPHESIMLRSSRAASRVATKLAPPILVDVLRRMRRQRKG